MDKQIRKLKKVAKKEVSGLNKLEKLDKKHDKVIEKAKMKGRC